VKLWTVQAPEFAAQLARGYKYSAGWALVPRSWAGAYEVMTAEMTARGVDCQGAPPVWAWPGWASPKQALYTADLLLGFDQWAHGVVMLRLAVPDDQILCTSYHAWNDFLNPENQLATMDFRGVLLFQGRLSAGDYPADQGTVGTPSPADADARDTRRQILRNPHFRHLLIPPKSTPQ
jgi:hypothetical protein